MIDFLKKIWAWIISIPQDKLLHFVSILLLTLLTFCVVFIFSTFWPAFGWANLLGVVASLGKELYDLIKQEGHTAEWRDLVADGAGLLTADGVLLLFYLGMLV